MLLHGFHATPTFSSRLQETWTRLFEEATKLKESGLKALDLCDYMSNEKDPGCSFRVLGRARFWPCTPHSKRLFLCIINIVSYGFGNTRGQGPRLSIRPTGSSVFVFVRDVTHVQICEKKVPRFLNFWVILETCPNLWWRSCSKCYAIDCFGTYLRHVQNCDDVRVQSATQSTASVHTWNMSKTVMTFVFKVLRIRPLRYILETCPKLDDVRVQSATQHAIECYDTWNISLVAYALQAYETMYIFYITTKYLWELRDSERARPRTRNVVV